MTDITKEFNIYHELGPKPILTQLWQQEKEIKEKIHVINVLTALSELQDFINDSAFDLGPIASVVVVYYVDNDSTPKVDIGFKDHENNEFFTSELNPNSKIRAQEKKIVAILQIIEADMQFDLEFFHDSYRKHDSEKVTQFPLNNDGIEKMKKAFLSDKLQASLCYAMLNRHVGEENKAQTPKVKI